VRPKLDKLGVASSSLASPIPLTPCSADGLLEVRHDPLMDQL
jgi:hypothetical protein